MSDRQVWTKEEVMTWLLSAHDTLRRLPDRSRAHKAIKAIWPDDTFATDPARLRAMEFETERIVVTELGVDEHLERRRALQGGRESPPSSFDIARMEKSISWPARYLTSENCRMMNLWACELSEKGTTRETALIMGCTTRWLLERVKRNADAIALGLRKDRVPLI